MAEITSELVLSGWELQTGNRWVLERERLRKFPAFKFVGTPESIAAAEGAIDTQSGNTYALRIELEKFPYSMPKIFPKDWSVHVLAPHRYNDGSLCIMKSSQWMKHYTVALVIAKSAIWLAKYEMWKRNGHMWPGLEQKHGFF